MELPEAELTPVQGALCGASSVSLLRALGLVSSSGLKAQTEQEGKRELKTERDHCFSPLRHCFALYVLDDQTGIFPGEDRTRKTLAQRTEEEKKKIRRTESKRENTELL